MNNILGITITTNHIFTGGVYIIAGRIGGPFGSGLPITIRLELGLPGLIIRPSVQYNPMITFSESLFFFVIFIKVSHYYLIDWGLINVIGAVIGIDG